MIPFSCDTMVAVPSATSHGQTLFAKNSDRPKDECQPLELHERQTHAPGSNTACQFVTLPQIEQTWRHVGSRPWWCWGYEHGFNEHQVVIGNEGLASRIDSASEPKLIGMEVLRIGLERGRTAREAVDWMTRVISQYGQGKFDNADNVRTYDNGYIVADPTEAFVIETAGHQWAVQRVERALGISNVYSVETDFESVSPTAESEAVANGWWETGKSFSFADAYSRNDRTTGSGAMRRRRACAVLGAADGGIDLATMMALLADHSGAENPNEPWQQQIQPGQGICVHYDKPESGGNTAASLIADLCADGSRLPVYWCSFYSPCLSLFFPVFIEGRLPEVLSVGSEDPTPDSPWWRFHRLVHLARHQGPAGIEAARARWAGIQQDLISSAYPLAAQAQTLIDAGQGTEAEQRLTSFMSDSVQRMLDTADELIEQFSVTEVAAG